ncbi:tRNA lysidine(34) synthetase TilS [Gluconobacter kanchanaburiensis]|nr:tRNA lysidine(34) synthetase TilS [Gluconobacter kanchanaburiensis]
MMPLGSWPPDMEAAPVGLAVSGGADSMALAFLARRWRRNVVAFVVDHGLRPASASEACLTVGRLKQMGIKAHLLKLPPFARGRIQERAREARFAALEDACVTEGCLDLLIAHHAADQEETVWMRSLRASGPAGLSGIKAVSIRGRIRIVRPLLSLSPQRLRTTLRAGGLPWLEDPSNTNRRFERVRWRQDLTPPQRQQAAFLQAGAVKERLCLEARLAADLACYVTWYPEGWVSLERDGVCEESLSALLRLVSGGSYRPSREAVHQLIKQGHGTLLGVRMRPAGRFGNGVILFREERAVSGPVRVRAGAVWDGRWRLLGADYPQGSEIAALGDAASRSDRQRRDIPAAVLRTLPGIWHDGRLISCPHFGNGPEVAGFVWAVGVPVTGENPQIV